MPDQATLERAKELLERAERTPGVPPERIARLREKLNAALRQRPLFEATEPITEPEQIEVPGERVLPKLEALYNQYRALPNADPQVVADLAERLDRAHQRTRQTPEWRTKADLGNNRIRRNTTGTTAAAWGTATVLPEDVAPLRQLTQPEGIVHAYRNRINNRALKARNAGAYTPEIAADVAAMVKERNWTLEDPTSLEERFQQQQDRIFAENKPLADRLEKEGRGMFEGESLIDWMGRIPFVGGFIAEDDAKVEEAVEYIQNVKEGNAPLIKEVYEQSFNDIRDYMKRDLYKNAEATWGAVIAEGIMDSIPYMVEFAATGGLFGGAKGLTMAGLKAGLKGLTARQLGVLALKKTSEYALRASVQAATTSANRTYRAFQDRRAPLFVAEPDGFRFEPTKESPAASLVGAFYEVMTEAFAERLGGHIIAAEARAVKPVLARLYARLGPEAAERVQALGKRIADSAIARGLGRNIEKVGFHGAPAELQEEIATDILHALTPAPMPGDTRGVGERVWDAVTSWADAKKFFTTLAIVSVPGAVASIADARAKAGLPPTPTAAPDVQAEKRAQAEIEERFVQQPDGVWVSKGLPIPAGEVPPAPQTEAESFRQRELRRFAPQPEEEPGPVDVQAETSETTEIPAVEDESAQEEEPEPVAPDEPSLVYKEKLKDAESRLAELIAQDAPIRERVQVQSEIAAHRAVLKRLGLEERLAEIKQQHIPRAEAEVRRTAKFRLGTDRQDAIETLSFYKKQAASIQKMLSVEAPAEPVVEAQPEVEPPAVEESPRVQDARKRLADAQAALEEAQAKLDATPARSKPKVQATVKAAQSRVDIQQRGLELALEKDGEGGYQLPGSTDIKTGKPYRARLYHGVSHPDYPSPTHPRFGTGIYHAFRKSDAAFFGAVEVRDVSLRNPLVIRSDSEWDALVDKIGMPRLRVSGTDYNLGTAVQLTPDEATRFNERVRALGYDSLVIDFPPAKKTTDAGERRFAGLRGITEDVPQVLELRAPIPAVTEALPPARVPWGTPVAKEEPPIAEAVRHAQGVVAAKELGGQVQQKLVDDARKVLSNAGLAPIHKKVKRITDDLLRAFYKKRRPVPGDTWTNEHGERIEIGKSEQVPSGAWHIDYYYTGKKKSRHSFFSVDSPLWGASPTEGIGEAPQEDIGAALTKAEDRLEVVAANAAASLRNLEGIETALRKAKNAPQASSESGKALIARIEESLAKERAVHYRNLAAVRAVREERDQEREKQREALDERGPIQEDLDAIEAEEKEPPQKEKKPPRKIRFGTRLAKEEPGAVEAPEVEVAAVKKEAEEEVPAVKEKPAPVAGETAVRLVDRPKRNGMDLLVPGKKVSFRDAINKQRDKAAAAQERAEKAEEAGDSEKAAFYQEKATEHLERAKSLAHDAAHEARLKPPPPEELAAMTFRLPKVTFGKKVAPRASLVENNMALGMTEEQAKRNAKQYEPRKVESKIEGYWRTLKLYAKGFTRAYPHLSNTGKDALAANELNKLPSVREHALRAIKPDIDRIEALFKNRPLDYQDFANWWRWNDMLEGAKKNQFIGDGATTTEEIDGWLSNLNARIERKPHVKEAIALREKFLEKYRDVAIDIGAIPEQARASRFYVHRMLIEGRALEAAADRHVAALGDKKRAWGKARRVVEPGEDISRPVEADYYADLLFTDTVWATQVLSDREIKRIARDIMALGVHDDVNREMRAHDRKADTDYWQSTPELRTVKRLTELRREAAGMSAAARTVPELEQFRLGGVDTMQLGKNPRIRELRSKLRTIRGNATEQREERQRLRGQLKAILGLPAKATAKEIRAAGKKHLTEHSLKRARAKVTDYLKKHHPFYEQRRKAGRLTALLKKLLDSGEVALPLKRVPKLRMSDDGFAPPPNLYTIAEALSRIEDPNKAETEARITTLALLKLKNEIKAIYTQEGVKFADLEDFIPEGHSQYDTMGTTIWKRAYGIPEYIAEQVAKGPTPVEEKNVKEIREEIRLRKRFILPTSIVRQLEDMDADERRHRERLPEYRKMRIIGDLFFAQKGVFLLNPIAFPSFQIADISGNATSAWMSDRALFKDTFNAGLAMRILQDYRTGKPIREEHQWLQDDGLLHGGIYSAEAEAMSDAGRHLNDLVSDVAQEKDVRGVMRIVQGYTKRVSGYAAIQDSFWRVWKALNIKQALEAGKPIRYGGVRQSVADMMLEHWKGRGMPEVGIERVSALVAKRTFGDPQAIPSSIKWLNRYIAWFVSWISETMRRGPLIYWNQYTFLRDHGIVILGKHIQVKGKMLKALAHVLASSRFFQGYALMLLWNNLFFGDEEANLSIEDRARPHLWLFRDWSGNAHKIQDIGTLGGLFEYIGFGTVINSYLRGDAKASDVAVDAAKDPLNKLAGSLNPIGRAALEGASGMSFFPDVTNPSDIDRVQALYSLTGMPKYAQSTKAWLTGSGDYGYPELLKILRITTVNEKKNALSNTYDLLRRWGEDRDSFPRSAFRNMKDAAEHDDATAFHESFLAYHAEIDEREAKTGEKDVEDRFDAFDQFVTSRDPLRGMSAERQALFFKSLSERETGIVQAGREYAGDLGFKLTSMYLAEVAKLPAGTRGEYEEAREENIAAKAGTLLQPRPSLANTPPFERAKLPQRIAEWEVEQQHAAEWLTIRRIDPSTAFSAWLAKQRRERHAVTDLGAKRARLNARLGSPSAP